MNNQIRKANAWLIVVTIYFLLIAGASAYALFRGMAVFESMLGLPALLMPSVKWKLIFGCSISTLIHLFLAWLTLKMRVRESMVESRYPESN